MITFLQITQKLGQKSKLRDCKGFDKYFGRLYSLPQNYTNTCADRINLAQFFFLGLVAFLFMLKTLNDGKRSSSEELFKSV